ncbi:MAG TPA: DUF5301 domain-containing protein [Thermoclostridium sp.]|nr:DUF5301 domain-containing protein [Thermoclostridium sp.]
MLEKIFLQILNMSLTAGFVIIFVLIARLFLKKSPKVLSYALWGVVLFRLICPFSFESIFSLLPVKSNPIPLDIVYEAIPTIDTGIPAINNTVNQSLPAAIPAASINPLQIWTFIGYTVWLMGIAVLLIYSIFSLVKLQMRLKNAVHEKDNIYLAKHLDTPFVMGFVHPKIYLPASLTDREKEYILLHEQMHIRRFDHVIKIVSFFALSLHWFNPLVWIAFFISGKDMEMSCDEAVIKQLGSDVKKEYSSSLLTLAIGRPIISGSPLAFGEGDTKGRIKNVLNYKKPAFWVVVISFVVVVALAISLLTNPKQTPINLPAKDEVFSIQIEQVNEGESLGVVQITETSDIETILMALQNTNKTLKKSYNDAPGRRDYFRIYIDGTTLQRLYLFDDSGKYYIEEPYIGFYKTNRETSVSIAKVYTSNGGVYPGNSVTALWNARTKYVGDNSAVGKLIGLLPVPEGLQYDHFKLHTSGQPYNIEIVYSVPMEELKKYDTENTPVANIFRKNALLLLALVDNAEGVRAVLTDGKREVGFVNGREWADYTVGGDVRNYAESPEKLQELINLYNANPIETLTQDQAVVLALTSSSNHYLEGECFGEGHIILGTEEDGNSTKLYTLTMTGHYGFQNDNFVKVSGTGVIPAAVTLSNNNDVSIAYPRDGSYYVSSIKEMFPSKYQNRIFDDRDSDRKVLKEQERAYAKEYLSKIGRKAEIGDYGDFSHTLLTDLGVSVEVSNKIMEDFHMKQGNYPYFIGTQEYIEDDLRVVYEMSYAENQNEIRFRKYTYETKEVVEQFVFDSLTGEQIAQ